MEPLTEHVFKMMRRIRGMDENDYLQYTIAYHAAPTIRGIKPATLLCPKRVNCPLLAAWKRCRSRIAEELGVTGAALRVGADSLLLLVYKPCLLRSTLSTAEAGNLLRDHGYDPANREVLALVETLRRKCLECPIPHEVGVFLGYPPRDVRCFMNRSCAHKTTGVWKAYGDAETAKRFFARCRNAKGVAAELIGAGETLGNIGGKLRDDV